MLVQSNVALIVFIVAHFLVLVYERLKLWCVDMLLNLVKTEKFLKVISWMLLMAGGICVKSCVC